MEDLATSLKDIPAASEGTVQIEVMSLPLIEEQLAVATRTTETGVVQLHKRTEQRTETVEVPLTSVEWHVEHVPVGTTVSEAPAIRQEGETTIYPVMEERVIVTKQLVLREEVRVTRKINTTTEPASYSLAYDVLEARRIDSRDVQG